MTLTLPRALQPGAHIVVLAASGPSERERIEIAARAIERRGFRVTIAANVDQRYRGYLAGPDDLRLAELNRALRDDSIDAFFFARGGYGVMRILDGLDYDAMRRNPRPLVGFSDITALHQALATRAGVASFHGPMLNLDFYNGLSEPVQAWCWSLLSGESPHAWAFNPEDVMAEGEAEGVLFGGCLSLTTSLTATPYDFWVDDGIWFWEDVDEPVYRIDRMLTHLKLSGRFRGVRGLVIGKLKGCGDESEMDALLHEFFGSKGIPVVRDFPFGHYGDNLLMPIGALVRLSTKSRTLTVTHPVVHHR
jgi:muramoyltetrapeptide carboxypeptidase